MNELAQHIENIPELECLFDGQQWRCVAERKCMWVSPSSEHPGFWHTFFVSIQGESSYSERSRRPMKPALVMHSIKAYALTDADKWHVDNSAISEPVQSKKTTQRKLVPSVYFIAAGKFVKIGWALDPVKRRSELQTGCPEPMRILATVPGTITDERAFHKRFEAFRHRLGGEWFRLEGALENYIASIGARP